MNTATIQVKHLTLGTGRPKICVPITGRTVAEILAQADVLSALPADLAEWRMDYCPDAVLPDAARALRAALPDLPLLYTFRTKREGGERALSPAAYRSVCLMALAQCDLLDIELFSGDALVRELVDAAHAQGVAAVVSSHDFSATPPLSELLRRLEQAAALGADLPKLAVMPRTPSDVLTLLAATVRYRETGKTPVITMSMGALGAVSRIAGEVFGSCLTFGAAETASAPGQLPAAALSGLLDALRLP